MTLISACVVDGLTVGLLLETSTFTCDTTELTNPSVCVNDELAPAAVLILGVLELPTTLALAWSAVELPTTLVLTCSDVERVLVPLLVVERTACLTGTLVVLAGCSADSTLLVEEKLDCGVCKSTEELLPARLDKMTELVVLDWAVDNTGTAAVLVCDCEGLLATTMVVLDCNGDESLMTNAVVLICDNDELVATTVVS